MRHLCVIYYITLVKHLRIIRVLDYSLSGRDWHSNVDVLTWHFRGWFGEIFVHCHRHTFIEGVVGLWILSCSIFFVTLFDHSIKVYIHRFQQFALRQMVKVLMFCFLMCLVLLIPNHLFYLCALYCIRSGAQSGVSRIGAAAISASIRSACVRRRDCFVLPACWYDVCCVFHLICCWSQIFPALSWMHWFVFSLFIAFQIDLSCSEGTTHLSGVMELCWGFCALSLSHCYLAHCDISCSNPRILSLLVLEF